MLELWPFQRDVVERVRDEYRKGRRAPCLCAPTGSGKTVMFAHIAAAAAARGTRTCILVHRRELMEQAGDKLAQAGVRHGIIASGIRQDELVVVASKDTLAAAKHPPEFDLIVIDEAHHATAETYRKVFAQSPRARLLGVSATPCRLDGKPLSDVFDALVVGPSVKELVPQYLAKPVVFAPPNKLDLVGVRKGYGDYNKGALEQALDKAKIYGDAIGHYRQHLDGKPVIVFCVSVEVSHALALQYCEAGIPAVAVDGGMPAAERKAAVAGLGRTHMALMSCDLISEGLDVPGVHGVQCLRPTDSLVIARQQWGRAMRVAPGKEHALILDHVGNIYRHGLPDDDVAWTLEESVKRPKKKKDDEVAIRQCPICFHVHEPAPECPVCGHVYEVKKRRPMKVVDGQLVPMTALDVKVAARDAKSLKELHAVAKAAGHKPGWAFRQAKMRGLIKK